MSGGGSDARVMHLEEEMSRMKEEHEMVQHLLFDSLSLTHTHTNTGMIAGNGRVDG